MADIDVENNEDRNRFEADVDGHVAFLDYKQDGDRLTLIHTEVPDELEGRGVGTAIARAAFAYARENDLTIVPQCAFVQSYLKRHPDEAATLKITKP